MTKTDRERLKNVPMKKLLAELAGRSKTPAKKRKRQSESEGSES